MAKLLLVDDDTGLVDSVARYLKSEHYLVESVHSGEEALDLMLTYEYDVIILDWSLPRMSGIEVLQQYRSSGGTARVIILTAMSELGNKEDGFTAGADDYLTKPFTVKELSLRIKALLRRPGGMLGDELKIANLMLNATDHHATKNGVILELTPKEFALLELFMRFPNHVFSAEAILDRIWKSESETSAESIKVWIKRLRRKLGSDGESLIKTVYGAGYKFEPPNKTK